MDKLEKEQMVLDEVAARSFAARYARDRQFYAGLIAEAVEALREGDVLRRQTLLRQAGELLQELLDLKRRLEFEGYCLSLE